MPCDPAQRAHTPVLATDEPPAFRIAFLADPFVVREALAAAMDRLAKELGPDAAGTVELVLAEVMNNIVEHAYEGGLGLVELAVAPQTDGLHCRVTDVGRALPRPDERMRAALPPIDPPEIPEGGFGWYLIRGLTRDLCYERLGGQNRLSFTLPLQ